MDSKKASFHAGGSRPRVGKSEALEEAAHTATKELVLGLVVHEEKVKIPRRSLFTCSAYIDHPIDSRTRFSTGDPSVYLVVDLNSEFVDKKLVVEVEKKDTGAAVATFSYTWDNACDTHAFKLKTEELIEKYGYGTYRATYDMDGKRMGRTDFRLVRE